VIKNRYFSGKLVCKSIKVDRKYTPIASHIR